MPELPQAEEPQAEGTSEFAPERWEVAIEDAAETVALLLYRGQAAAETIGELWRTRPIFVSAAGAAMGGAFIGALLAGHQFRRRRRPMSALAQATAVAQAAVQRRAQQQSLWSSKGAASLKNGVAASRPRRRLIEGGRTARQLIRLLPIVVAVLKNPLVRQLLWRYAVRAVKR